MVQDTGNRLVTAIQKQTEKVGYFCSAENISPNLAVHEMRKCFKRLRALLKFYNEPTEEFPRNMIPLLKNLGRQLAPLRESYVNLQMLERITVEDHLVPDRRIRTIKERMAEKNRNLLDGHFQEKEICGSILRFKNEFEKQILLLQTERPTKKQLEEVLAYSFLRSHEIFTEITGVPEPEVWHDLRNKLKALWYQMDHVKFLHPRYFKLKSDQLNKITEQLGEDHDFYVFSNEIKLAVYELEKDELTILFNQVQHQRELNLIKLQPRLKQFFNEIPSEFEGKMEKIFRISAG